MVEIARNLNAKLRAAAGAAQGGVAEREVGATR